MLNGKSDLPLQFLVLLSAIVLGYFVVVLDAMSWIVPMVIGVVIAGYGGFRLFRGFESSRWKKTSGSVQSASIGEYAVAESEYSRCTYYYPIIQFSYVVRSHPYLGSRSAIDIKSIWSSDRKTIEERMKQYAPGSTVTVYFRPSSPEDGVLFPGLSSYRASHYAAMVVGGMLISGMGYVIQMLLKNA